LRKTKNIWNLRWLDLSLSIFIFIFTSFNFYAFFYLFRESIRYISVTYENDLWFLSTSEVRFYNIFYAAIALIMAMGSVSRFLTDKPSFRKGSKIERTQILNDSRILNWVFIMWSAELGGVIGIFFALSQSFYEFSLYASYRYLFILFVMVLYLKQWTTYRRLFTSLTKKWFLPITIIFLLLSFLLGSVNIIDYQKLNQKILNSNPYHKISISKPTSTYWKYSWYNGYNNHQLYFGIPHHCESDCIPQLLNEDGSNIKLNSLDSIVLKWKSKYSISKHSKLRFQLNINESILMKDVNLLKDAIEKAKIFKIGYSVVPENIKGEEKLKYKHNILPAHLYNYGFIDSLYPDRNKGKKIYVLSRDTSNLILDNHQLSQAEFKNKIEYIIESDTNYMFLLEYDSHLEYGKFIELYSTIYGVIMNKREEFSKLNYHKKYERNKRDIKREISMKYPMNIEDSKYQKE